MKLPVTAVIPVKNEGSEIADLVNNLHFVDEVLFVDNGSTDNTVAKIRATKSRLLKNQSASFAGIRQFGDDNASHDWILSMDADMRVTPELIDELKAALTNNQYDAYRIGRRNIIFGREMKHTDWSPYDDCHIRFYNRAAGSWQNNVHELWQTDGVTGTFKNSFIHNNYKDVEEFVTKIDRYSQLAATSLKTPRAKKIYLYMCYWSARDFIKRFVYKLGFLDGYHGLMLSYLQAIYYLCLGVKIYEKKS